MMMSWIAVALAVVGLALGCWSLWSIRRSAAHLEQARANIDRTRAVLDACDWRALREQEPPAPDEEPRFWTPYRVPWVSVEVSVPNDRRQVLAWGDAIALGSVIRSNRFIVTRFNPGGGWDCATSGLTWFRVTHWADVLGPDEQPARGRSS